MKKTSIFALLAALLLPVALQGASKADIPPASAQALKAEGLWIDVRSPREFSQGHLQGAINIPVGQIGAEISSISPDKQAPIHLYCRSGRRADAALKTLKQLGYTNVINHGGYEDVRKQGLR